VPSQQQPAEAEAEAQSGSHSEILQTTNHVPATTAEGLPGSNQSFNAADALTELSIHGLPNSDGSNVPTSEPGLALQRRESNVSTTLPGEPSTSSDGPANLTSSTTLEQYQSESKSPEDHKAPHIIPPDLPLFIPAQPQRSRNRASVDNSSNPSSSVTHKQPTHSPPPHIKIENTAPASEELSNLGAPIREGNTRTGPEIVENEAMASKKKRAAPKTVANRKKGTARKPTAAKRKSGAAVAKQGKKSTSPTPDDFASAEGEEDDVTDESDPNAVFCICRKGDNHTWMIACDGGCDEWFHGKCINMKQEVEVLIDKYICAACTTDEKFTTWKRLCRRIVCGQPARVDKKPPSKYCSDDCAVKFFTTRLDRSHEQALAHRSGGKGPKKRRANKADHMGNGTDTEGHSEDEIAKPNGGALLRGEVKALVEASGGDITKFRSLGNGALSAGYISNSYPDGREPDHRSSLEHQNILNKAEQAELSVISSMKNVLREQKELLRDREKFIAMLKEQHTAIAARDGTTTEGMCGFDARLCWSEGRFKLWRKSEAGIDALKLGTLGLPHITNGIDPDSMEVDQENGVGQHDHSTSSDNNTGTFCTKVAKRCQRHQNWSKLMNAENRFEDSTLGDRMRELDRDEKDLFERAKLRRRRESSGILQNQGAVQPAGTSTWLDQLDEVPAPTETPMES
jgi:COMPASS component SPP1